MASRVLQHLNVVHPRGGEPEARAPYAGTLGLEEVPKPPGFHPQGSWFQLDGGSRRRGP
jgi:hypothetical protein